MKVMTIKGTSYVMFMIILLLAMILLAIPERVGASYQGGRLIDNNVFLHATSMSKSQIQNFLEDRNSGLATREYELMCYGSDSKEREWYTNAGAECDEDIPASHIIYYAARIYGVSPKVILSTLQKEQSLVTTSNPTSWQLDHAMGYGCPTSGSCSTSSFPAQIDSGTWALRWHYERANGNNSWWRDSSGWTCGTEKNYYKPNLYPKQNVSFYDQNGVKYRTHYINNAATSALYCYTPHAYNNPDGLYGRAPYGTTGMYYSGSYNFVYWYEAWFGSTTSSWALWSETGGGAIWSTEASPSLSFGPNGDFLLTAIAEDGHLLVRKGTFGGSWAEWETHSGGSNWSSATAGFNDESQLPRIFAIDKDGQMHYRYKNDGGWSNWSETGGGAVWSTEASPSLSFGPNGKFILSAITKNGYLRVRQGSFGGSWDNWQTLGGSGSWANVTAGFNDESQLPRIFAIDKDGQMHYQYFGENNWVGWSAIGGGAVWSTYSAPHLSFGPRGEFLLTAITNTGSMRVRQGTFGGSWNNWATHAGGNNWKGVSAGFNDESQLPRIFAIDKDGQMHYRYKLWL